MTETLEYGLLLEITDFDEIYTFLLLFRCNGIPWRSLDLIAFELLMEFIT